MTRPGVISTRERQRRGSRAADCTARLCLAAILFGLPATPLAAQARGAGPPVDYPLALKTRWTFHLHQELAQGVHFGEELAGVAKGNVLDTTLFSEVVGTDTIEGKRYARIESLRAGKLWLTEWYRLAPDGLLLGKTFDRDTGEEIVMVPPQKVLSPTLEPGEAWTWKASAAPVTIRMRVVGPAEVQVPAATFQTTHVEMHLTADSGQGFLVEVDQQRWFTPGVGYVKQETETHVGPRRLSYVLLTLEKFAPAAAPGH